MKYLKLSIYGVLIALFYSTYIFFDRYSLTTIYIRHMSLLLFIGVLLYNITNRYFNYLFKRYQPNGYKEHLLYVSKVLVFAVVLIGSATIQYQYIEYSVTLSPNECFYFDQHQNLLFTYHTIDICQEPVILSNTDDELQLQFNLEHHIVYPDIQLDDQYFEELDGTFYRDVFISVEYVDEQISYAETIVEFTSIYEGDNTIHGYVTKEVKVADYTNPQGTEFIFKEALVSQEFTDSSISEILSFDFNTMVFEEEDFSTTRYYTTEYESTNEDITYSIFREALVNEEINTIELTRYAISKDTSLPTSYTVWDIYDRFDLGSSEVISVEYTDNQIRINRSSDSDIEFINNTSIYGKHDEYFMLESARSIRYDVSNLDQIEMEGITTVESFSRNGTTMYRSYTTFTDLLELSDYYYTIESTEYGYVIPKLGNFSGSFWEYLFGKNEDQLYTTYWYNTSTLITERQQYLIDYTSSIIGTYNENIFFVTPIYIQKTALD